MKLKDITIKSLKADWNNLESLGKINILLGLMLLSISFVWNQSMELLFPDEFLYLLMGCVIMYIGSQDKKEAHPEYQKKITDYIEMEE